MVYDANDLLRLGSIVSATTGKTLGQIAVQVAGNRYFFRRLAKGESCTLATSARAGSRFAEIWPAGVPWPRDLPRLAACDAAPDAKEAA